MFLSPFIAYSNTTCAISYFVSVIFQSGIFIDKISPNTFELNDVLSFGIGFSRYCLRYPFIRILSHFFSYPLLKLAFQGCSPAFATYVFLSNTHFSSYSITVNLLHGIVG